MNFAELKQEVANRGYDYVPISRIGVWVERAYQRLCSRYAWPFLQADTTGTGEIADLGHILSVFDNSTEVELSGTTREWLINLYSNLTLTGAPEYWYLENKTLQTYPVSGGDSISIRYLRVPPALTENAEPLIPEAWQYVLVELAVIYALRDNDEYTQARELDTTVQGDIAEMVHALLKSNYQGDGSIVRTGYAIDYLR